MRVLIEITGYIGMVATLGAYFGLERGKFQSSGQQIFLSVIFKLAILLKNGITDGIVIIDEGIGELKLNTLHKLIDILKTLPYQFFLIYQNIDEIKDVNVIEIERIENESRKK